MSLKRISLSRPAALTLIVIISGGLGGCVSAPPVAPPAPKVPYEQKMIWIFQLEDQRLIKLPDSAAGSAGARGQGAQAASTSSAADFCPGPHQARH